MARQARRGEARQGTAGRGAPWRGKARPAHQKDGFRPGSRDSAESTAPAVSSDRKLRAAGPANENSRQPPGGMTTAARKTPPKT
jgi:hypothetical protein